MEDLDPYFLLQDEYFHNLAAVQRMGTSSRLAAMTTVCALQSVLSPLDLSEVNRSYASCGS